MESYDSHLTLDSLASLNIIFHLNIFCAFRTREPQNQKINCDASAFPVCDGISLNQLSMAQRPGKSIHQNLWSNIFSCNIHVHLLFNATFFLTTQHNILSHFFLFPSCAVQGIYESLETQRRQREYEQHEMEKEKFSTFLSREHGKLNKK